MRTLNPGVCIGVVMSAAVVGMPGVLGVLGVLAIPGVPGAGVPGAGVVQAATIQSQRSPVFNVEIVPGAGAPGCEETDSCVDPFELSIDPGDTVEWFNNSGVATTVTGGTIQDGLSGEFDSGLFFAGQTFSHTFDTPGMFEYFSLVHPWIQGIVTVAGDVPPPPPPPPPPGPPGPPTKNATVQINPNAGVPGCEENGSCYLPFEVNVFIGGTVTWENDTSFATTVTSGDPAAGLSGVFDSGLLFAGQSFSHTFDTAGSFDYFSMVHPWMHGIVTVVIPEPSSAVLLAVVGTWTLTRPRNPQPPQTW